MSKSLSKDQQIKKKVRDTPEWKQLRIDIQEEYDNKDPITNKKLIKGFNVHHCCMKTEEYDNLDIERFRPHNKKTHDFIHWLFRYYVKDHDILDRIKEELDLMEQLN